MARPRRSDGWKTGWSAAPETLAHRRRALAAARAASGAAPRHRPREDPRAAPAGRYAALSPVDDARRAMLRERFGLPADRAVFCSPPPDTRARAGSAVAALGHGARRRCWWSPAGRPKCRRRNLRYLGYRTDIEDVTAPSMPRWWCRATNPRLVGIESVLRHAGDRRECGRAVPRSSRAGRPARPGSRRQPDGAVDAALQSLARRARCGWPTRAALATTPASTRTSTGWPAASLTVGPLSCVSGRGGLARQQSAHLREHRRGLEVLEAGLRLSRWSSQPARSAGTQSCPGARRPRISTMGERGVPACCTRCGSGPRRSHGLWAGWPCGQGPHSVGGGAEQRPSACRRPPRGG